MAAVSEVFQLFSAVVGRSARRRSVARSVGRSLGAVQPEPCCRNACSAGIFVNEKRCFVVIVVQSSTPSERHACERAIDPATEQQTNNKAVEYIHGMR